MLQRNNVSSDRISVHLISVSDGQMLTKSYYYPVPDRGDGVLFSIDFFVCMCLCFFVSLLARLRENCWTDLHKIFREGVE